MNLLKQNKHYATRNTQIKKNYFEREKKKLLKIYRVASIYKTWFKNRFQNTLRNGRFTFYNNLCQPIRFVFEICLNV